MEGETGLADSLVVKDRSGEVLPGGGSDRGLTLAKGLGGLSIHKDVESGGFAIPRGMGAASGGLGAPAGGDAIGGEFPGTNKKEKNVPFPGGVGVGSVTSGGVASGGLGAQAGGAVVGGEFATFWVALLREGMGVNGGRDLGGIVVGGGPDLVGVQLVWCVG